MPFQILDIGAILEQRRARPSAAAAIELGRSREGRSILGYRFGRGAERVSLIGGCHADEPVGPAMLDRLAAYLELLEAEHQGGDHPVLRDFEWRLVPHVNPDGEERNRAWTEGLGEPSLWTRGDSPVVVDLGAYLAAVVRERPGDDIEFGFPRGRDDSEARPEPRAVAAFLRRGAEGPPGYLLHGSFHGMAFAAGPWFLIEASWAERTASMRRRLVAEVEKEGYTPHDIDRAGDKGFARISRGFTTRPDSRAMVRHFENAGDLATAALFRPSSMETVRSLGGDPLTLVSEMPLFCLPPKLFEGADPVRPPELAELRALAADPRALEGMAEKLGLVPMPIRDQIRFQLAFLDAGLVAAREARGTDRGGGV